MFPPFTIKPLNAKPPAVNEPDVLFETKPGCTSFPELVKSLTINVELIALSASCRCRASIALGLASIIRYASSGPVVVLVKLLTVLMNL